MFPQLQHRLDRLTRCLAGLILRYNPSVTMHGPVTVVGAPLIQIQGRLTLGGGVVLNSPNVGYHANMAAPVKLFADRPDAEIIIGDNTRLNGACVHAWRKVVIGHDTLLASGVQILDANGHQIDASQRNRTQDEPRPVRIGNNVWIGLNAIVLPGVTVGDRAVIGAGSVVSSDVPEWTLVAGAPARFVRSLQAQ